MLYFDGQYLRATREYEVVLDTGEYEVNGINLFARMADCALQVVTIVMRLIYMMKLMKMK